MQAEDKIKRHAKMKIRYKATVLCIFTLSFFCVNLAFNAQKYVNVQNIIEKQNAGYVYLMLQHESNPLELPHSMETIDEFNKIYQLLAQKSKKYTYYELNYQPLYCDNLEKSMLQCIQISDNVQKDFTLNVTQGSNLKEKDFLYTPGTPIPVIVGNHYGRQYQIGTQFNAEYLFSRYTFVVIGVLEEGLTIELNGGTTYLDDFIVTPSFYVEHNETNDDALVSLIIHYANKTSGKLKMDPIYLEEISAQIHEILSDTPVGAYSYYDTLFRDNVIFFGLGQKQIVPIFASLAGVLALLGMIMQWKGKANTVPYKQKKRLYSMLCALGETAVILLSANILSIPLTIFCARWAALPYAVLNMWISIAALAVAALEATAVWKKQAAML